MDGPEGSLQRGRDGLTRPVGRNQVNAFFQSTEYAIRAMTHLAQQRGDGYSLVREMSKKLDFPSASLVKVLQPLVRRGLVTAAAVDTGGSG
ncbi:MAG: hypothetical protein CMJ89_15955 [Planctomycetes bacterium]|jgi:DNA-binding IscR family transcriptional regulator|nr:hypothetical protein [Planctomycetota bacterium]